MNRSLKKYVRIALQTIIVVLLVVSISQARPNTARALFGVADITFTTLIADTSPTGISDYLVLVAQRLKEFVLDKLVVLAAKQVLHQMTVSVVNWANTGFEGRPAFLTNPRGFFLDAADQVTGEFLNENGPLRSLCSPWSVDIRIAIALDQTRRSSNGIGGPGRYTCTLGRIIDGYQGAGVGVSVNGGGINGFIGGDFSQGGWPAFIAMTTEDQNSWMGTALQARSDQLYAVGKKQNDVKADLQQGGGFMSKRTCERVAIPEDYGEEYATNFIASDPSIEIGPDGPQRCTTRTPGSVISSILNKNLNSPTDELLGVKDINTLAGFLITKLVTQTLQKGLYSLSGANSSPNSGRAYLQSVYADAVASKTIDATAGVNTNPDIGTLNTVKSRYTQAVDLVEDSRDRYENALSCLTAKITSGSASPSITSGITSQISLINTAISTQVYPLYNQLSSRLGDVNLLLGQLGGNTPSTVTLSGSTNVDQIDRDVRTQVSSYLNSFPSPTPSTVDIQSMAATSEQDLDTARQRTTTFNTDASSFQAFCISSQ